MKSSVQRCLAVPAIAATLVLAGCGAQVAPSASSGGAPSAGTSATAATPPASVATASAPASPPVSATPSSPSPSLAASPATRPSASATASATASASASASPSPSGATSPTQARIDELRAYLRSNPDDGQAYRDLGIALLQRVRETGDPSLYDQADEALTEARTRVPSDPLALVAVGLLQLARHEFDAALETGRAALRLAPIAEARGVVVDALTELGRYDEAVEELQLMIDQKPNLASYARVSYARELRGDLAGALEALELAVESGGGVAENVAFIEALRGNLLNYLARRDEATAAYERALALVPDHAPALAGLGRLAVAEGDLDEAIGYFTRAAAIVPLPEYVIALGEAQEAAGDVAAARESYELARFETQLLEASGVLVDLELAIFEADHGDPERALGLARSAYEERQTIHTADALAWASYRTGDLEQARQLSAEALRLGSENPLLLYHAGAIAAAAGDTAEARTLLERALTLDPGFSATGAAEARRILADL